jgi:lysophospholipase L1-like esterase
MAVPDIRICFVGDSFVNGTGDESYLGWAGRLCNAANTNDRSLTYYNLGIRRNTSSDILKRWEQECEQRLPDSSDARFVLSCGANDMVIVSGQPRVSIEESLNNITAILQKATAKYKTILVGPAPVGDGDLNIRLKSLSAAYQQTAASLGIPYIEVFSKLITNQQYLQESSSNDGYHPKSDGYAAIAHIIVNDDNWWFK